MEKCLLVKETAKAKMENGIVVGNDHTLLDNMPIELLKVAVESLYRRRPEASIAFGKTGKNGQFGPVSADMPKEIEVYTAKQVREAYQKAKKNQKNK